MNNNEVFKAEEIAQILKVTPQHIYNLSSPKLPDEIRIPSFSACNPVSTLIFSPVKRFISLFH